MSDAVDSASRKAEQTYNAAADHFTDDALAFWDRYGQRTVHRASIRDGERVLDVCCGAGASALPAAEAVGAGGSVTAVDLAEGLLEIGRRRANARGLRQIEFRRGNMSALAFPDRRFDAVVCVFGIFFAADMEAQTAELWRMVRPSGRLAITTWGPGIFSPAYEIWLEAVRRVRPDLYTAFNPWDRITTPESVRRLFADAGIPDVEVTGEEGHQPLRAPEDFWTVALGSGLRWTIDQMGAPTALEVKREIVETLAARRVDRIATNVIYAVARRE